MGPSKDDITFEREVKAEDAILIPNGVYHNVLNTGEEDLKLYSIYGPAHHPHGTVHETKEIAEEAEHDHDH